MAKSVTLWLQKSDSIDEAICSFIELDAKLNKLQTLQYV
jgi:hypothetical protein